MHLILVNTSNFLVALSVLRCSWFGIHPACANIVLVMSKNWLWIIEGWIIG